MSSFVGTETHTGDSSKVSVSNLFRKCDDLSVQMQDHNNRLQLMEEQSQVNNQQLQQLQTKVHNLQEGHSSLAKEFESFKSFQLKTNEGIQSEAVRFREGLQQCIIRAESNSHSLQVVQQQQKEVNVTHKENEKRLHDLESQQTQTHQGVLQELEKVHNLFRIQEENTQALNEDITATKHDFCQFKERTEQSLAEINRAVKHPRITELQSHNPPKRPSLPAILSEDDGNRFANSLPVSVNMHQNISRLQLTKRPTTVSTTKKDSVHLRDGLLTAQAIQLPPVPSRESPISQYNFRRQRSTKKV